MPAKKARNSSYKVWFDRWWTWEAIAAFICCASTVALVLLLRAYDEQPVPSFGTFMNSNLTLATTVSLLSTVTVSAALVTIQECLSQLKWLRFSASSRPLEEMETFDRASRGPFGSSVLIWKLRFSPIASLGALLTIASLTVAPLTQQAATYAVRRVADPLQTPTVPITLKVKELLLQPQTSGFPRDFDSMSSAAKGAVLTGLFSPANIRLEDVAPTCSSGNCTFAPYNSLAVCSSVADVTSGLFRNATLLHEADEDSYAEYSTLWCIAGSHCLNGTRSEVCNVTSASDPEQERSLGNNLWLTFNSTALGDHGSPLADVYIIYINSTGHDASGAKLIQAVEFTLDWCVATFNTSVNSGVAVTSRTKHPFPYYTNSSANDGRAMRRFKYDLSMTVNETRGDQTGPVYYTIDWLTHATMQTYFSSLFSGASLANFHSPLFGGQPITPTSDTALILSQAVGFREDFGFSAVDRTVAEAITNLQNILNNVATSMTNYHRAQGGLRANGTSFGPVPIVVVRWGYVAAPIVFCVMNVIFFVSVSAGCYVWRRGQKLPVWKSSVVPLLRLMDPRLQERLGSLVEEDERSSADRLKVQLVMEGKGWQLRTVRDDLKAQDEYPLTEIQPSDDEGRVRGSGLSL